MQSLSYLSVWVVLRAAAGRGAQEVERREFDVQARLGCAMCDAHVLLADDAAIRHPHTLGAMLACLRQLRQAVQLALPDEALYWLVHNGTVHIFRLAAPLLTAGYAAEVLPYAPANVWGFRSKSSPPDAGHERVAACSRTSAVCAG